MLMHNTDDQFLCTLSSVLCQSGSIAQQEIIYAYANPLPDSHCIDSICIWVSKCYYKYCYFLHDHYEFERMQHEQLMKHTDISSSDTTTDYMVNNTGFIKICLHTNEPD